MSESSRKDKPQAFLLGSPPNVDNELIDDHPRNGMVREQARNIYRVHLDVLITKKWNEVRKYVGDMTQGNALEAYHVIMENIEPEANRTHSVKMVIAGALGLDDIPPDRPEPAQRQGR